MKLVTSQDRKGVRTPKDPITEESLVIFKSWTPSAAMTACDERMKYLESRDRETHIERGMIIIAVEKNGWFKEQEDPSTGLPFNSMDAWLLRACPISRSAAYAAKGHIEELQDIPAEDLRQMPACNLDTVRKMSKHNRKDPKVIEAAKTMRENQFLEKISKEYPEEHIEEKKPMKLNPDKSARIRINETLQSVMWCYSLDTREQALEALCSYFDNGSCEAPGYEQMSNIQAYAKAKGKGDIL